ncbi:MAG: hypothetical protein MJ252_17585 [archaeon]|nr:hypothetical protein [archaeon]
MEENMSQLVNQSVHNEVNIPDPTINVISYFKFYTSVFQTPDIMMRFKSKILNEVQPEWDTLDLRLFQTDLHFDFYLLYLLHKKNLISLNEYLNLKNSNNYYQYLAPSEDLFHTCEILFKELRKILRQNFFDESSFETIKKMTNYLKYIIEVLKNVKHRNENPDGNLYQPEVILINVQEYDIQSLLFDVENIYFIIKILICYSELVSKNLANPDMEILSDAHSFFKAFTLLDKKEDLQPGLKLRNFLFYYVSSVDYSMLIQNRKIYYQDINSLLSYMKFNFILIFSYFVELNSEEIKAIVKKNNLIKEYNSFIEICNEISYLDHKINTKPITALYKFMTCTNAKHLCQLPFEDDYLSCLLSLNERILTLLFERNLLDECFILEQQLLPYLNKYNEWMIVLKILLSKGHFSLAFQLVNNAFAHVYNTFKSLESFVQSPKFEEMKSLYNFLFEYLLTNEKIELLFSMPLNFIERTFLQLFFLSKREYSDLMVPYFLKTNQYDLARSVFENIRPCHIGNYSNTELYKRIMDGYKKSFGLNEPPIEGNIRQIIPDKALYCEDTFENKNQSSINVSNLSNLGNISMNMSQSNIRPSEERGEGSVDVNLIIKILKQNLTFDTKIDGVVKNQNEYNKLIEELEKKDMNVGFQALGLMSNIPYAEYQENFNIPNQNYSMQSNERSFFRERRPESNNISRMQNDEGNRSLNQSEEIFGESGTH